MRTHKDINYIQFAFTYLGSFLGVGYVSGRELWEFFGSFGLSGYIGLTISTLLLLFFGIITVELVNLSETQSIAEIVAIHNNKFIKIIITLVTYSSMFAIFVIMTAGAGVILEKILLFDKILGSVLFTLIIFISVICGIYKVVKLLNFIIPILVCSTLFICVKTLNTYDITINLQNINNNPLLNNWFSSTFIYFSTNALASFGTLITIAPLIKNKKHSIAGCVITSLILCLVGAIIILTMSTMPKSINSDLPMLYISLKLSDYFGLIYSFLLFLGMFSAAIGNITALSIKIREKFFNNHKKGAIISASIICISGTIISNLGFAGLIKSIYPILGYFGIPIIFLILLKYIYLKQK